jgi:hypothetical protein
VNCVHKIVFLVLTMELELVMSALLVTLSFQEENLVFRVTKTAYHATLMILIFVINVQVDTTVH